MKYFYNLTTVLLLIATVMIFAGMKDDSGKKVKIVCFGDSITHGAKVNGRSWVYL